MVAAVRPRQQLRIRFEMRYPRLRVETRGEVVWAKFSGQCGIRFLDLPSGMGRQINEWIFGDLLEGISLHADRAGLMFGAPAFGETSDTGSAKEGSLGGEVEEDDGLLISTGPLNVIQLPMRREPLTSDMLPDVQPEGPTDSADALDWLSQPLSARGVGWTIDALVVVAAMLLFLLVFLSVTRESPPWPFALAGAAMLFVAAIYWGFFWMVGGESLGKKLARLAEHSSDHDGDREGSRFR